MQTMDKRRNAKMQKKTRRSKICKKNGKQAEAELGQSQLMPEVIVKVSVDVEIKVEVEDVVKSIVLVDGRVVR